MRARCFSLIVIAVLGGSTGASSAPLPDSTRAAIEHYRALIGSIEAGPSRQSLEPAFESLRYLEQGLMQEQDDGLTVLESLSAEEYARLERELAGALLFREEGTYALPDPEFFIKLASEHGDKADQAFFEALKATYPQGSWPVYNKMETDYGGCTRFGSMTLVETYGAWTDFRRHFPNRYRDATQDELDDVLEELEMSTCACDDFTGVEKELSAFIKRFPKSPDRPAIEKRLEDLRRNPSKMRVRC